MLNIVLKNMPDSNGNNVVVILSGGLDSTTLLYTLKRKYDDKVIALTFDYNQRHSIEIEKAKITCQVTNTPHHIIPIKFFGDLVAKVSALSNQKFVDIPTLEDVLGDAQPLTYVPYRNMLFLTLALSFAETNNANFIFIGVQTADLYGYWDTTPEFIKRMNAVSELNRQSYIQLVGPFVNLTKGQEILIGQELGLDFSNTWSCYSGPDEEGKACGTCPTCMERLKAFNEVGLTDPIKYKVGN